MLTAADATKKAASFPKRLLVLSDGRGQPELQFGSSGSLNSRLHAGGFAAFHAARATGHFAFFAGFFLAFFVVAVVGKDGAAGEGKQGEGKEGLFHGLSGLR